MHTTYRYNIGQTFAATAAREHASPALKFGIDEIVTYGELDTLTNQTAFVLRAHGIRRGDVVAIVHTKTAACYATMLACLKLGAVYVNIDDQNPALRLGHIFRTAQPRVVVADGPAAELAATLATLHVSVLDLGEALLRAELRTAPIDEPAHLDDVTGADPAYIMYTSGSTGVPKGALITHANVLNFAAWTAARFAITPRDTLTNLNPMYFDNSVFDFYAALLNGAALAPIPRQLLANPPALLARIEAAACTIWFSVPSFLIYLTTLRFLTAQRLTTIRTFVFGGEGYPKPELRKLYDLFGARSRLVNVYGPTECTCICSAWDVRPSDLEDGSGFVTLGPLAANFSGLVLDEQQRPVPAGEIGELYLLGPQVGLGYVNERERTMAAFVRSPCNTAWAERTYRTGDLVKLRDDGRSIDFVGRRDNQIKHMGYRVELEEIEAALNAIPGVTQSAVMQSKIAGLTMLHAHLAVESPLTDAMLRSALELALPAYMIPERFEQRTSLPKNANGKVDRLALAQETLERPAYA